MPSEPSAAPFAQAMTAAMTQAQSAFDEFTRMFSTVRMPAVPDSEALLAAHKRNIEALTQANRVAMEGAQAVARRHMEIMQQSLAELGENMRTLTVAQAPQERASTQAELLRRAYERAVANTQELAGLIQGANNEAIGLLNHRVTEAMAEMKALTHQAGTAKPAT